MPHTFFAPDLNNPTAYTLPEDESKHAVRVLRLRVGDAVELIDGKGGHYYAEVANPEAKRCLLRIVEQQQVPRRPYFVHVAVAPTKNLDRMEWLVEKATEIGIDRFSFLRCARSERRELKLDRLERIAISALKQSGQVWLPQFDELTDFNSFVRTLEPSTTFIAHLAEGERISLGQVASQGAGCCILIGPEGDFTPEEINLVLERGIKPVTLGQTRLRTETAALAACHTVHVVRELV